MLCTCAFHLSRSSVFLQLLGSWTPSSTGAKNNACFVAFAENVLFFEARSDLMTGKEKQTPLHLTSQCMVAEQVHLQPNSDINLKQRTSIHRFYAGWRLADSSIPISFIFRI